MFNKIFKITFRIRPRCCPLFSCRLSCLLGYVRLPSSVSAFRDSLEKWRHISSLKLSFRQQESDQQVESHRYLKQGRSLRVGAGLHPRRATFYLFIFFFERLCYTYICLVIAYLCPLVFVNLSKFLFTLLVYLALPPAAKEKARIMPLL